LLAAAETAINCLGSAIVCEDVSSALALLNGLESQANAASASVAPAPCAPPSPAPCSAVRTCASDSASSEPSPEANTASGTGKVNDTHDADIKQISDKTQIPLAPPEIVEARDLPPMQALALEAIMRGDSLDHVARAAFTSERRIRRWLYEDHKFRAALATEQHARWTALRGQLLALADEAVNCLVNTIGAGHDRAAKGLLRFLNLLRR
jgi:hypothetical protein